jgi:hypothetical protein
MASDDDLIKRGDNAGILLKNDTYNECMHEMHSVLHASLDSISSDQTETVMSIVRQLRAIKVIKGKLEAWEQEGRRLRIQRDGE